MQEEKENNSESKQQTEGEPKLIGVTSDEQRFVIPKTKAPFGFSTPLSWNFVEWFKYGGIMMYTGMLFFLDFSPYVWVWLFLFWRVAYNGGLGYILYKQSKTQFLTHYHTQVPDHPFNDLLKRRLTSLMGKDYDYDKMPPHFNAWVSFRALVEIILAHDVETYLFMCIAFFEMPPEITIFEVIRYIFGILLCVFALWAKIDAYQVVSDFAWYWGDFFFLIDQKLTFNRIFALFPHPMYTVGYAWYYGCSLITQSFIVFYVSLFAHISQLLFLSLVENPHIEKTYGSFVHDPESKKSDYRQTYYRRDLIVFKNFDFFRSSDTSMLLIILYSFLLCFLNVPKWVLFAQVLGWRLFHNGVLGFILHCQSKYKSWTNHFLNLNETTQSAFEEWKRIYNLSLTMNYISMAVLAIYMAEWTEGLYWGITRITLAITLIALNIWSSVETYEVLGEFGWFFGDFFIDELKPTKLYYTGIYRFLNNPDNFLGFAGYYGLALLSASWPVFGVALFSQFCNWVFLKFVETPHMKKLYGDSIRKKAGFEEGIKEIIQTEKETMMKRTKKAEQTLKTAARVVTEEAKKVPLVKSLTQSVEALRRSRNKQKK